jgi:hypothetical protein
MDMKPSRTKFRQVLVAGVLVLTMLACSVPVQISAPTADLGLQATSQALALQATFQTAQKATLDAQSVELQKAAAEKDAADQKDAAAQLTAVADKAAALEQAAADADASRQTAEADKSASVEQTAAAEKAAALQTAAAPTADPNAGIDEKLKKAKILLFEDTQPIGFWIKKSLDSAGYKYTFVGDAVGDFLEALNSGINWDLIIVGAESKSGVRGEFWDAINDQLNRGAALVVEIWYLDLTVNGRIRPVLTRCGIKYQKDLSLADSIYWLEPTHPVFNSPNTVMPLLHYARHWDAQAGDLIGLIPGSSAELIAGTQKDRPGDYGQIAVCMDGTVIFQTFSNHDYSSADIQLLWQNYVDYTLRNHFKQ